MPSTAMGDVFVGVSGSQVNTVHVLKRSHLNPCLCVRVCFVGDVQSLAEEVKLQPRKALAPAMAPGAPLHVFAFF